MERNNVYFRPQNSNSLKNFIFLVCFLVGAAGVQAQHKIGVRAGFNFSTISGPLEEKEDFGVKSGFHFGINYTYMVNDKLGLRGEILYTQRGSKQSLIDTTDGVYYVVQTISPLARFVDFGKTEYTLEITNSYISVPLTVQYQINRKFEVFGGMSVDFLIGPVGRGKTKFVSLNRPDEIFFEQNHDHRYNSDEVGEYNTLDRRGLSILLNGESASMAKTVGAYYSFFPSQKTANRFKALDAHLILGFNYFLNTGFYIGARAEYGLADITNNEVDYSLRELDDSFNYIFRDDKDRSISLNLSFGFRF